MSIGFELFNPKNVFIIVSMILLASFLFYTRTNFNIIISNVKSRDNWVILIILFTAVFALFSPNVGADGPSFYIPNVDWISRFGNKFNPYLTQYTTMPLAIEHIYTFPYKLFGEGGLRTTDFVIGFLLIKLLLSTSKKYLGNSFYYTPAILALLIPGSILMLIGTGKIDIQSSLLIFTGFVYTIKPTKDKLLLGFVIFSIALGAKYSNWIILGIPTILIWLRLLKHLKLKYALLLLLLPCLFLSVTLIKNYVHVNSALAPLILNGNESRFISTHGGLPAPLEPSEFNVLLFVVAMVKEYMYLIFLISLLTLVFFKRKNLLNEGLDFTLILVVTALLSFAVIVQFSPQPNRFVLGILCMSLVLICFSIQGLKIQGKAKFGIPFALNRMVIFTLALWLVLVKSDSVKHFWTSLNTSELLWYESVEKEHYTYSLKIKELGLINKNTLFFNRPSLNFFEAGDYGALPTDSIRYNQDYRSTDQYDFICGGINKMASLKENRRVLFESRSFVILGSMIKGTSK